MFTIYYQKVSTCDETICTNFTIEPEKDTKKLTRKLYEGYSKKIQFCSGHSAKLLIYLCNVQIQACKYK